MGGMRWYRVDGPNPFAPEPEAAEPPEAAQKKIYCASIEGAKKYACWAVWRGGRLGITKLAFIPTEPGWQNGLRAVLAQKKAEGYAVYLEDRTGLFSQDAVAVSFEELQADGRTLFQHACEMLTSLSARGDVKYPPEYAGYVLSAGEGGIVDLKTDDKGRVVYDVDWNRINGGHKCVLMAVAAATMEEPWSDRWLSALRYAPPPGPAERGWDATCRALKAANTYAVQDAFDARQEAIEKAKEKADAR